MRSLKSFVTERLSIIDNVISVVCDHCGWSWSIVDSGSDIKTCHQCGETVEVNIISESKSTDRTPLENNDINTHLEKLSKDKDIPIGILRAVMRRGMGAWNSSHRKGATQEQWGYARVNAFIDKGKGTWGGSDKDLAKEIT